MILITTYYISDNESRNEEIRKCLCKNAENTNIKKIYLLNNKIYNLDFLESFMNKVIQYKISGDENYILKYSDAVEFINNKLKSEICILSNSDIYFDETLSKIDCKNMSGQFLALLRYDEDKDGNKNIFMRFNEPRDDSQDCWIFKSPLKINLEKLDFTFRTLGCDSIFALHAHEAGLKVSNPSLDVVATHVHNTEYRTYNCDNRIHGNYCLIKPCQIGENPELRFMDY